MDLTFTVADKNVIQSGLPLSINVATRAVESAKLASKKAACFDHSGSLSEFLDFNVQSTTQGDLRTMGQLVSCWILTSTTVRTTCLLMSSSILTSSQLHSHDGVSVSEFLDSNVESTLAVS